MDDILTAVETARKADHISSPAAKPLIESLESNSAEQTNIQISPAYILETLKTDPGEDQLCQVLRWLDPTVKNEERGAFDIRHASPLTAPILQALASKTVPDHWRHLEKSSSKARGALLRCMCSIPGLRALVTSLQISVNTLRTSPQKEKDSGRKLVIQDTVSFLAVLLKPTDFAHRIYQDNATMYDTSSKRHVSWSELCSLLAGGKVLSTAAEAVSYSEGISEKSSASWLAEGASFSRWLGLNMGHMVLQRSQKDDEFWKATSLMIGRALGLGHTDKFVHELYTNSFEGDRPSLSWHCFFDLLRPHEQVAIVQFILKDLQTTHFGSYDQKSPEIGQIVGAVAALVSHYIEGKSCVQETILNWLSTGNSSIVNTIGLRRVLLLLYSKDPDTIRELLTQSLSNFGDAFNIKHSLLQFQEANAQILLLAAGYLHRSQPGEVEIIARSPIYLNVVSNRLAASSSRARFLGMVVGMAISELVEPPGKGLKFDLEGPESEEAQWYLSLTRLQDKIGEVSDLSRIRPKESAKPKQTTAKHAHLPRTLSSAPTRQTTRIVAIEEVEDDEDESDENDEFIPYEKPDSDASDTEEDPTLIQRGKPSAPVYIRDLVAYLKDTENADRYHLGITYAPSLIRRKATFGTELVENIDNLAMTIIGLQDNYSLPKFHEYRLQAMIALLVAQPVRMGRLFTATFFDGDLSQTQRSAILTALGLGARELAGHGEDDAKVMGLPSSVSHEAFPSKKLPSHVQGLYAGADEESPVSVLTKQLSRTSLQPLALDAADAASGPNALKVRTFSSRMEVERQRQQREAQRKKKTISTDLHKDLTEGFFYPLVGRFAAMLQSSSSLPSGYSHMDSPNILRLFIQTITLVISTLGPHSPALPTVTQNTLILILSLHGKPISSEPIVLPALLSLFLASIDLNTAAGSSAEERLVTDHASEVMELREWTNDVFERTPAASGSNPEIIDDTQQTRILAAGILVKLGEVVERYHRRLMGVSVGFKY